MGYMRTKSGKRLDQFDAASAVQFVPGSTPNNTPGPFAAARQFTTSGTTQAVGYDQTDNLLILAGQTIVNSSADLGATLSADKGVPLSGQSNPGNQIGRIVRFKGLWVCLIKNQSNSSAEIYTSPAPGSSGSCTWTLRKTLTGGSDGRFSPCLDQDGTQVIVGEYGDPLTGGTKNPHIWRSTDGLNWTSVWSASGGNNRHVHAVAADPYIAGDWWATFGDGPSPCVLHSTDGGQTWAGVAAFDSARQSVSISFDATTIYFAVDNGGTYGTSGPVFTLDRATGVLRMGALSDHRALAVPSPGAYTTGRMASGSAALNDFTHSGFGAHQKGAKIEVPGSGIPAGTTILNWDSPNQLTLSAAATTAVTDVPYQIHGVSEQWYSDPFFGCIDPATGIYYFTTPGDSTGKTNIRRGLFYVPYQGGPVQLLGYMNTSPRSIFIAAGYLFCGNLRRPVLTLAA